VPSNPPLDARHAFRHGNYPEALRLFELGDSGRLSVVEQGICRLATGEVETAIALFRRQLDASPGDAESLAYLACGLETRGDTPDALKTYRKALASDMHLPLANANLGYLLLTRGNIAGAAASLQRALDAQPPLPPPQMLFPSFRADALPGPKGGDADYRASLACLLMGLILLENGRFAEARSCFEHAVSLFPANSAAHYGLVNLDTVTERDSEHVREMRRLLDRNDVATFDRGQICFALGKAMNDLGDHAEAMRYFDEAHRIVLSQPNTQFDRDGFERYVDSIIQTFSVELLRERSRFGSQSELPVLIVGMVRSGTTLVEQILSSHRDVAAGEELRFWRENGASFLGPGRRLPTAERAEETACAYLQLLRRIGPDSLRVTDKMPQNFVALGLIHVLFPDARLICCRRNAVDTCLSIYMTSFRNGLLFANSKRDIVFFYRQFVRLMDHWRSVIPPDRLLEVGYENLLSDREAATRRLVDFCGLVWDDECMRPEANPRTVKTASLWQVRQPVYSTSQNKSRHYAPYLGEFRELLGEE
jgi:tetratricopeptide (TPR) repeat protein